MERIKRFYNNINAKSVKTYGISLLRNIFTQSN